MIDDYHIIKFSTFSSVFDNIREENGRFPTSKLNDFQLRRHQDTEKNSSNDRGALKNQFPYCSEFAACNCTAQIEKKTIFNFFSSRRHEDQRKLREFVLVERFYGLNETVNILRQLKKVFMKILNYLYKIENGFKIIHHLFHRRSISIKIHTIIIS